MSGNNSDLRAPWKFEETNHGVSYAPAYGLLDCDGMPLGIDIRTVEHLYAGGIKSRPITNAIAKGHLVAASPKMFDVLKKILIEFLACRITAETMTEVRDVIGEAKGEPND